VETFENRNRDGTGVRKGGSQKLVLWQGVPQMGRRVGPPVAAGKKRGRRAGEKTGERKNPKEKEKDRRGVCRTNPKKVTNAKEPEYYRGGGNNGKGTGINQGTL